METCGLSGRGREVGNKDLAEENQLLRKWIWLNHGHLDGLYGDDGEMQCGRCLVDFKRDDAAFILDRLYDAAGMRWARRG